MFFGDFPCTNNFIIGIMDLTYLKGSNTIGKNTVSTFFINNKNIKKYII